MNKEHQNILNVLDKCCESSAFPMLDNGYVYAAATRLSLYRSSVDWAMVIEVFGFSPRGGIPDIQLYAFGSRLRRERSASDYVSQHAYDSYLAANPNNESCFVHPIEEGEWLDNEDAELVSPGKCAVIVRGKAMELPDLEKYEEHGVPLQDSPRVRVFELCRLLAAMDREKVLATEEERRTCIPPELERIMQLDEWCHPDIADGELPGESETFRALAEVLAGRDISVYAPCDQPNTHWKNWPDGGAL